MDVTPRTDADLTPDAFYLGRYFDEKSGGVGKHITIIGPTRVGKDAGIILHVEDGSLVVLDPKRR